eukprot:scaffold39637_cov50-Phaeocystis_antarctica.AAC.3
MSPGAHRRGDAGHGARVPHPRSAGRQAARARGRPLPAGAGGHVQEGRQGRTGAVALREDGHARRAAHPAAGAVPHAPVPLRVPFEHLLRGHAAERRHGLGAAARCHRLPVAQPKPAHVLLLQHGPGGGERLRHVLPQPHRGGQRREARHALPQRRHAARADRRRHPVRGAARLPRLVHAA